MSTVKRTVITTSFLVAVGMAFTASLALVLMVTAG